MNIHSSGPWRTGDMFGTVFGPPNGTPCPDVIAVVRKNHKANACLIAAAPELLEALEEATHMLRCIRDDEYVGVMLSQLNQLLDGDTVKESVLYSAVDKARGRKQ